MATVCVVLQSGLKSWLDMVTTTASLYVFVPRQKMCTPWGKKRISRVLIFAHPSCAKIVSLIFAYLFCAKINVTRNLGKVRYPVTRISRLSNSNELQTSLDLIFKQLCLTKPFLIIDFPNHFSSLKIGV